MKKSKIIITFTENEVKDIVKEYVEKNNGKVVKIKSKIKLVWDGDEEGKFPDKFDGMTAELEEKNK